MIPAIAELTDKQIGAELAKAMGWVKKGKINWQWYRPGTHDNMLLVEDWSPATRWDHVFIGVDWMEREKDLPLIIEYHHNDLPYIERDVHFVERDDEVLVSNEHLSPRHIALAILESLRFLEAQA